MMTNKPRFLRATLIAPLAVIPLILVPTLVAILSGLYNGHFSETSGHELLAMFAINLYACGVAAAVAYGYTLVLGLPAYFVLWKSGYLTTGRCALAGALFGGAFGVFYLEPLVTLVGALYGATVAATFCKIAGRRGQRGGKSASACKGP